MPQALLSYCQQDQILRRFASAHRKPQHEVWYTNTHPNTPTHSHTHIHNVNTISLFSKLELAKVICCCNILQEHWPYFPSPTKAAQLSFHQARLRILLADTGNSLFHKLRLNKVKL